MRAVPPMPNPFAPKIGKGRAESPVEETQRRFLVECPHVVRHIPQSSRLHCEHVHRKLSHSTQDSTICFFPLVCLASAFQPAGSQVPFLSPWTTPHYCNRRIPRCCATPYRLRGKRKTVRGCGGRRVWKLRLPRFSRPQ